MGFKKLDPSVRAAFEIAPEIGMDMQLGFEGDKFALVVGARLAIFFDDALAGELREFGNLELIEGATARYGEKLEEWLEKRGSTLVQPVEKGALKPEKRETALKDLLASLAFIHLGPRFRPQPPPSRPARIYGHLPFQGTCSGGDVYYRYEHFPTSRRITGNQVTAPDTYAAPASEEQFTPTGLSAVARFALPSLLPACWRWQMAPNAGTPIYYGASVPLYGQSGGAVEVCFPKTPFSFTATANPNPKVLDIL